MYSVSNDSIRRHLFVQIESAKTIFDLRRIAYRAFVDSRTFDEEVRRITREHSPLDAECRLHILLRREQAYATKVLVALRIKSLQIDKEEATTLQSESAQIACRSITSYKHSCDNLIVAGQNSHFKVVLRTFLIRIREG